MLVIFNTFNMIREFILKGLFSHKNSTVKISPFLTVITGQNDSGKSSILHGLRWFIINKPRGGKFLLDTANFSVKEGSFTIVNDDCEITKSRTNSNKTYYKIGDEKYHKADMPEEIQNVVGITPYKKFGDTEIELNFAFQLDAPFLISEAPAIGALILGQLAGTNPVDLGAKQVTEKNNEIKAEIKSIGYAIQKHNEKIGSLEVVEECLKMAEEVQKKIDKYNITTNTQTQLIELNFKHAAVRTKVTKLAELTASLKKVDKLQTNSKTCQAALTTSVQLSDVLNKYDKIVVVEQNLSRNLGLVTTKFNFLTKLKNKIDITRYEAVLSAHANQVLITTKIDMNARIINKSIAKQQSIERAVKLIPDHTKWLRLISIQKAYTKISNKCGTISSIYSKLQLNKLISKIATIDLDKSAKLTTLESKYITTNKTIITKIDTIKTCNYNIDRNKEQLNDLFEEYKVCPICKKPFTECKDGK